jgi:hypothetical protein
MGARPYGGVTHILDIIDISRKTKIVWPGEENTIYKTII